MTSPFPTFLHQFHIILKSAIFILIKKRWEKFLVVSHISTSLFPHDHMGCLTAIHLISKSSKETISISHYISQPNLHRFYLLVEVRIILQVDVRQLEGISFSHFLSHLALGLSICLSLLSCLLYHPLLIFFLAHFEIILWLLMLIQHCRWRYKLVYMIKCIRKGRYHVSFSLPFVELTLTGTV